MASNGIAAVRITGLRETTKAMKQLDDEAGREVTKLNRAAAEVVAETARPLVPVGGAGDTHPGLLLSTIRAGATQRSGYVKAGSTKAPYANPIHWGWPSHGITGSLFLLHALQADTPEIAASYDIGFRALIQKVGLA